MTAGAHGRCPMLQEGSSQRMSSDAPSQRWSLFIPQRSHRPSSQRWSLFIPQRGPSSIIPEVVFAHHPRGSLFIPQKGPSSIIQEGRCSSPRGAIVHHPRGRCSSSQRGHRPSSQRICPRRPCDALNLPEGIEAKRQFSRSAELGSQIGTETKPVIQWSYAASFFSSS